MKLTSCLRLPAIILVLSLLTACSHTRETSDIRQSDSIKQQSITPQMNEEAFDGTFPVAPIRRKEVDANSQLVISFPASTTETILEASQRWKVVNGLLESVAGIERERGRFVESVLGKQDVLMDYRQRIHGFNTVLDERLNELGSSMQALGLSRKQQTLIWAGKNPAQPYRNLLSWLKQEIETMRGEAEKNLKDRDNLRVTVQAFHDPVLGSRKAVHVEGYDTLPDGTFSPIDRYGLNLTPAERERFAMEYQQAEVAASSLREVMAGQQKVKLFLNAMLTDLESGFEKMASGIKRIDDFKEALIEVNKTLEKIAEDQRASAETRAAAAALIKDIYFVQQQKAGIHLLYDNITELRYLLKSRTAAEVDEKFILEVITRIGTVMTDVEAFANNIAPWKAALADIEQNFGKLAEGAIKAETKKAIEAEWTKIASWFEQEFPATISTLKMIAGILRGNNDSLAASNLPDNVLISRPITDLPKAVVRLDHVGLTQGDEVMVKVKLLDQKAKPGKDTVVDETTYYTRTVLMGWHRVVSADLIFARGLSGDATATKWKPNVAASANWHYTVREPSGKWEKFVNGINPGLGIHLASLSQGNESVEFGVGMNLSFFGGLLKGGGGFNLSVNEKPYVFVAIDLLNVLNQSKGMAK